MAFSPVDDLVGAGSPALVALTGVGLIGFALFVLMVAGLEPTRLWRGAAVVSVADAAWVVATMVVVSAADLEAGGVAVLGGIAVVVAGFALGQLRLRAKAIRVEPAYSTHE